jgi:hypothetical protein
VITPVVLEYIPDPQSPQVEATLGTTTSENLPVVQLVQTVTGSARQISSLLVRASGAAGARSLKRSVHH